MFGKKQKEAFNLLKGEVELLKVKFAALESVSKSIANELDIVKNSIPKSGPNVAGTIVPKAETKLEVADNGTGKNKKKSSRSKGSTVSD